MTKRNEQYWKNRAAQRMWEYMQSAEETADEAAKFYQKAAAYLNQEIDGIFEKYMTKHNLSEKEAYELLNQMTDRTSIQELMQKLQNGAKDTEKEQIIQKLEAPAYRARIERLEQIQSQLDQIMRNVYQQELALSTSHYAALAEEAYYKSVFNIQQRSGYGFSFAKVDQKMIDRLLKSRWSGKNYSTRIWNNTGALAQTLKEELLVSLVTGRTERETAAIIMQKFAQGSSQARRLIRTESSYITGQIDLQSYDECGIEKYVYLATLDLRTCQEDCAPLDGKIFPVKDAKPGVNMPPMHPWCRCTTISYFSDEILRNLRRRARDPVTGKTHTVPGDMTYKQWYAKYAKGAEEGQPVEKKNKGKKEKNLKQDVPKEKNSTENYVDVIKSWKEEAKPRSESIDDLAEYTVNGVRYFVDGKNVKLDYSSKEKEIAELLQKEFGGEIKMVPRILKPQGISTPDYIFKGEAFDLKELLGTSKNLVYNAIAKKARQASNFILDVSNCPLDMDEIARQIDYIYWSKHTRFVDKVIVIQNGQISNVYKRIK